MTGKRFTEIYIPLGGPLYRVAFFILESRQDAEDALALMKKVEKKLVK